MADDVSLKVGIDTEAAIKSLANLEKNAVNSTKRMESAFSALKGVAVAAVGFLAARGVLNFFEEGIAGAVAQEQAFARLEAQMIATGENTEEAAKAFNDLASELESTTKFGDDAVLAAAALAKSYGITNQQALELTRTAADLASATGVELEAAVEQLTASYSGNVKALGKLVPEVKGLTKEQLAAGEAVELLGKRFSGAANKEIQTYAGAVKQASNAFENFREAFGTLITQNKAVVAVINGIGKLFQALQKVVEDNQEAFTEFINFGVKALVVGISIAVDSLRALVAGFGFVAESALQTAAAVFAAFGDIARAIEKVTGRSAFSEFFDEAALKAANFSEDTTESISKIDAVFEKVSVAVDEFSQGVFDATEAVDTGAKKAEKSTAALGRQIVQTAKDTEKLREEGEKFLADLKKTGATDTQKVVLDAEEAFKKLGQLVKEGALTANQAREASLQITKNQILKEIELRDKANKQLIEDAKKAAEEARKRIADIAADPVTFTVKKLDIQPLDISQQAQESAALGVGFVSKVLEGAAGAKSLISAGAGAFADSLLPGIGGAVGGLISKLAEGPDATKKFVKEFTAAVPVIVDSLVNKGGAVKIGIAIARAMSGEAIAKNIGKQIGVQFGSSFSPETIGSKIASGFVTVGDKLLATFTNIGSLLYNSIFGAFIAGGQQIISFFGQALAQIPQAFVTAGEAILAPIRDFFTIDFSSLISGAFASVIDFFRGAGLFDGVNAAFKPIIDFLDAFKIEVPGGSGPQKSGGLISGTGTPLDFLAKGGIVYAANGFVPRGTDTVPAMLTPGEMVLNRSQQSSLFNLANSGGGGSEVVGLLGQLIDLLSVPMTTEVSAEVNGKTIADIVLQQSRQRARLSV
jgi:hypothetical protein